MQHIKLLFSISSVIFISLLSACGGKKHDSARATITPITVVAATPGGNMENGISVSGKIEAVQTANISTRIMGTINHIYVTIGDKVRKGQLLVTINNQDIQAKQAQTNAAILEAQANVTNAQKDFERFTNLYNKQSASAKELDNITLQYTAAKARLEAASQMKNEVNAILAYASLTAPFDGVVTQKLADEGNMANPGMPLLTIEQNTALKIGATVSASAINLIKKGNKAFVEIKAIDKKIECPISEISPSAQFTGGQYEISLSIPEAAKKDLYAGMYVNIFIPVTTNEVIKKEADAILVPTSCLVNKDQLTGLYTISNSKTALLRWVRTGKTIGDKIEILSGLGQNEKFIVSSEGNLYNGVPVIEK